MERALGELEREFWAAVERTRRRLTRIMETLVQFLTGECDHEEEELTVRRYVDIATEIASQQGRQAWEVRRDLELGCRIFIEEGGEAFLPNWINAVQ